MEFLIVSWKLYEESEETYVPDQPSSHASGVATSLAAEIQNPETGDVIIETVHKDGTKVRYYVLRQVVCCYPYFKAGSVRSLSLVNAIADEWRTECHTKRKMDPFLDAGPSKVARTERRSHPSRTDGAKINPATDHRKIIKLHGDSEPPGCSNESMHNLLYYLYTGKVNLHFDHQDVPGLPSIQPKGYPPEVDAFELHALARFLGIEKLETLCLEYVRITCTIENVSTTLITKNRLDESLIDMLVSFIKDNYKEVTQTHGWEQIHSEVVGRKDEKDRAYLSDILLRISRSGWAE